MKAIKVLLIAVVAACAFADASAQLPPPPPPPPNPLNLQLKKPSLPGVRSRKARARRHGARVVTPRRLPAPPPLPH